jgi:hypothetical protein
LRQLYHLLLVGYLTMPTDHPPLSRSFSGPITKTVARFVVCQMLRMEEADLDPVGRWEFLRRLIEHIAEKER